MAEGVRHGMLGATSPDPGRHSAALLGWVVVAGCGPGGACFDRGAGSFRHRLGGVTPAKEGMGQATVSWPSLALLSPGLDDFSTGALRATPPTALRCFVTWAAPLRPPEADGQFAFLGFQLLGVETFGEAEFWLALIKLIGLVAYFLFSIV